MTSQGFIMSSKRTSMISKSFTIASQYPIWGYRGLLWQQNTQFWHHSAILWRHNIQVLHHKWLSWHHRTPLCHHNTNYEVTMDDYDIPMRHLKSQTQLWGHSGLVWHHSTHFHIKIPIFTLRSQWWSHNGESWSHNSPL